MAIRLGAPGAERDLGWAEAVVEEGSRAGSSLPPVC